MSNAHLLQVGDEVETWHQGKRENQRERIVKIGSKYIYTQVDGKGRISKYHRSDQRLDSPYSGGFWTLMQAAENSRRTNAVHTLKEYGITLTLASKQSWSTAQLETLVEGVSRAISDQGLCDHDD